MLAFTNFLKFPFIAILILLMLVFQIWGGAVVWELVNYSYLKIEVLDVGQGDSMLITGPDGFKILIDAGKENSGKDILDRKFLMRNKKIDAFIISHPDGDHVGKALDIIEDFDVDYLFMNLLNGENPDYLELVSNLDRLKELQIFSSKIGDKYRLGCCINMYVIWPQSLGTGTEGASSGNELSLNDLSYTVLIEYGDFHLLAGGDLSKEYEEDILSYVEIVAKGELEFLKVNHHGSSSSTSEKFIERLKPDVAVIQVGADNSYGHPTKEVLDTLRVNSVEIFRTDLDGEIRFRSDGVNFEKI